MLSSRIRTLLRSRRTCYRYYSNATNELYSPKVRAYPFAVSKEEAIRQAGIHVSLAYRGIDCVNAYGARYFPGSGFQPKQPTRIQAIYLPAWIVNGVVEAKVWFSRGDGEEKQQSVTTQFKESYMPGFAFNPLSRMSLLDPEAIHVKAVPFSQELTNQHGSDVLCIPYTLSPFSLVDAAKSVPSASAVISEDWRIDPATISSELVAAYPVLLPVYLARYDAEEGLETSELTVVMEAHQPEVNIIMHNFIQDRAKTFGVPEDGFLGRLAKVVTETDFLQVTAGAIFPSPMKPFFANIEHILVAPRMRKRIAELTEWIVWKAYSATAMEKYQEFEQSQRKAARLSEGVDFDDVRIREFSRAEMDSVMSYMSMGTEVVLLRDMIERISITNVNGEHQGKVVHIDLGSASNKEGHDASSPKSPLSVQPLDQFLIDLKQKLEEAEKKQQEHKPEWLKQWQEQQKHLDDSKNPVLKQAS